MPDPESPPLVYHPGDYAKISKDVESMGVEDLEDLRALSLRLIASCQRKDVMIRCVVDALIDAEGRANQ